MLTAIVGINWGDEGKGRMVDLLSADYDVVCRYQGGNNAGHTVVNERGKFILNLLPSGILREGVANVMGPGMVIDIEHLNHELEHIAAQGVVPGEDALIISDRATICMPYDKLQDGLEEDRLADRKFGSTRRGIAPVYADKYMKKALRMGDLLHPEGLKERLRDIVEWKNLTLRAYGAEADAGEMYDWLMKYGEALLARIKDTTEFLHDAIEKRGADVMFEAQLGALRDIDFGIYPYTSSSTTLAAYAPIGAGVPAHRLDCVVGIMKAYSSCVGEGPFTCEFFGEEAEKLRALGGEYGAATGRPAARRRLRRRREPLRRARPGRDGARPHEARRPLRLRRHTRLHPLRGGREDNRQLPLGRRARAGEARLRVPARLRGRHLRLPRVFRAAGGRAGLCKLLRGRRRLPIKYVSVGAGREQIIVR